MTLQIWQSALLNRRADSYIDLGVSGQPRVAPASERAAVRRQPTNRAPHTGWPLHTQTMCLPQTLLMPAKREFYILQSCCCSNCYFDPVPDGCLDGPILCGSQPVRAVAARVTFDFHTGDVEVCCFQEDFACLAAPADAPRVCGVLGYTLYPAKGCCITLKQLYPERPEIVLKQNNTVLCAGCVGVGEKTLWSQAIYCRPPATFLFVELRCCCLAHDFGLNIAGDGDGILPNCVSCARRAARDLTTHRPMACARSWGSCACRRRVVVSRSTMPSREDSNGRGHREDDE